MASGEEALQTDENDNIDEHLSKMHEDVHPGCKNSAATNFLGDLMDMKGLYKWSNESFDALLVTLNEVMPEGSTLPDSFDKAKSLLGRDPIAVPGNKFRNSDGTFVNKEVEECYNKLTGAKERNAPDTRATFGPTQTQSSQPSSSSSIQSRDKIKKNQDRLKKKNKA